MWHDADERIVAIGSVSGTPDWDRSDDAVVFTAAEVLASLDEFLSTVGSGPILIWDPIGGPIGVSVAETLVARGVPVQIDIAALIDAGPRLPADGCGLVESAVPTSAGGESVTMVGDCVAPRTIYEAILEGRRAALSL